LGVGGDPATSAGVIGGNVPGVVVTTTYAATHGIDADVLIRADGGGGGLFVRDFPQSGVSRDAVPRGRRIFLIDFDDDFDARAREAVRGRLAAYAAAGWDVPVRPAPDREAVVVGRPPRMTGTPRARTSSPGKSRPGPARPSRGEAGHPTGTGTTPPRPTPTRIVPRYPVGPAMIDITGNTVEDPNAYAETPIIQVTAESLSNRRTKETAETAEPVDAETDASADTRNAVNPSGNPGNDVRRKTPDAITLDEARDGRDSAPEPTTISPNPAARSLSRPTGYSGTHKPRRKGGHT
jgi:hypothetical protein